MLIICRPDISQENTKVDFNFLYTCQISSNAKILYVYCFQAYLPIEYSILAKLFNWSTNKLTRVLAELVQHDLIALGKKTQQCMFIYVGTESTPASAVKDYWDVTDIKIEQGIIPEEY